MESESYEAVRNRVEQRHKQRTAFYVHLVIYIVVCILLWALYFSTRGMMVQLPGPLRFGGDEWQALTFPWPLIVYVGWGIGLVAHCIYYVMRYGDGARRRQAAI